LLAGVERVARVADADDNHRLGGACFDHVAAGATDFRIHIFRMNVRLHKKERKTTTGEPDDKREFSHPADPLAVFPNGLEGREVAPVKKVFRSGTQPALFQIVPCVAGVDGGKLEDAGIAIAVNHAARAAVADEFRLVELVNVAHGLFPKMAAVKVEIPVEVKIFVTGEAAKFFTFAAQMPLHFIQRLHWIDDSKTTAPFHPFDFLEQLDQLVFGVTHQAAVAETQVAAGQRSQRITERAALETECFEKRGQFVVIIDQPARRNAGGGLNADRVEEFIGAFDLFANVRQAAVFFVLGDVVGINGHDDAAQAVAGETTHVLFGPQTSVRTDHRVNAALGGIAGHCPQITVHHRFAADEKQITNVVLDANINHVTRLLKCHAMSCLRIGFRTSKAAEIAVRITNVRYGKLQVTRPAMIEHFTDEFERALLEAHDWFGKVRRYRSRQSGFGNTRTCRNGRITHGKPQYCVPWRCYGQTLFRSEKTVY
jgi:hypothetical protein